MAKLRIDIDLSVVPTYCTEPDELCTILREIADWLEERKWWERDYNGGDSIRKQLKSFDHQNCGIAEIR